MITVIGYLASILIVFSMVFKTTTYKGTMFMRFINSFGSICFIIYGIYFKVYPTALANMAALIINIIFIIKEYKDHKTTIENLTNNL